MSVYTYCRSVIEGIGKVGGSGDWCFFLGGGSKQSTRRQHPLPSFWSIWVRGSTAARSAACEMGQTSPPRSFSSQGPAPIPIGGFSPGCGWLLPRFPCVSSLLLLAANPFRCLFSQSGDGSQDTITDWLGGESV